LKKAELEVAAEMIGEAGDAVEMILSQGLDAAMTKYNRRKTGGTGRAGRKVEKTVFFPFLRGWKRFEATPIRSGSKEKEAIMEERYYDLVFIVRPATPEDEIKKVLTVIEHTVAEKRRQDREDRALGHPEAGVPRGPSTAKEFMCTRKFAPTHGELIAELERRLRVQDNVIKYQTVRLDEDLKRQKKLSQKREKSAPRGVPRPPPQPRLPPPAAAAPAAPEQARGNELAPSGENILCIELSISGFIKCLIPNPNRGDQ